VPRRRFSSGVGTRPVQWATPSAVQGVIQSEKLDVGQCSGGVCKIGLPAHHPDVVQRGPPAEVLSATVAGIGPYKLINDLRHYQLFNVRACTVYYYRGAHRFGVHFRWFTNRGQSPDLPVAATAGGQSPDTRRPPGGTTTFLGHYGGILAGQDSGEPYARDWSYPLIGPIAQSHC
jgi:hypothetical protein